MNQNERKKRNKNSNNLKPSLTNKAESSKCKTLITKTSDHNNYGNKSAILQKINSITHSNKPHSHNFANKDYSASLFKNIPPLEISVSPSA